MIAADQMIVADDNTSLAMESSVINRSVAGSNFSTSMGEKKCGELSIG
jgi:hypothetical protein